MIKGNNIYVDKTGYLAQMLGRGKKAWLLNRPRGFGKSLTVSTFEAIFSGKKELFRGLEIENRLEEPFFSPRPFIYLDMSEIGSVRGLKRFESALRGMLSTIAKSHGVEVSNSLDPEVVFSSLIKECHKKYDRRVAILIDEYDTPVTNLLENTDEMKKVSESLQLLYRQLKSNDEYISLVFVTVITKIVLGDLFGGFNNAMDISIDRKYGALTGFTHEEILRYYPHQISAVAASLKMSENKLLSKMKKYYDGFCFDGKTFVYNPYSILCFFQKKEFRNFWFTDYSPTHLITFLKKKYVNIEQFRNYFIPEDNIHSSHESAFDNLAVYLFQLGYLSLRPYDSDIVYLLDYPNVEVRESLARRILANYFNSKPEAKTSQENIEKAFLYRNPTLLINELNKIFAAIPYEYNKERRNIEYYGSDEDFLCSQIFLVFYAFSVNFKAEKHENLGRTDFVVRAGKHIWVIEVKVSHNDASPNNKNEYEELTDNEAIDKLASEYIFDERIANEGLAHEILTNQAKYDALREKARKLAARILTGKEGLEALGQAAKIMATTLLKEKEARKKTKLVKQVNPAHPADQKLADAAFEQILNKNYADEYDNPVLLGFVINAISKKITAYKHSDGFPKKWEQELENDEPREPRPS
jgi:hypothetical protein